MRFAVALFALFILVSAMPACAVPPALDIDGDPLAMPCAGAGRALLRAAPLLVSPVSGTPSGGDVFQAGFDTGDWSGHLERYAWLLNGAG